MDDQHLHEILKNDAVKKAIANAGEEALKHPEVQAQMKTAAQEQFPELAHAFGEKIVHWAQDPEAQEHAKNAAGFAFEGAKRMTAKVAEETAEEVYDLIKQGPAGIRALAFFGSMAALVVALWDVVKIWHIIHPASYVIDCWQMIFAFTSSLFEAHPSYLEKSKLLDRYHDVICEYGKFLCFPLGRALFYFFQGSIWVSQIVNRSGVTLWTSPPELIRFCVGVYLLIIGQFNLWMHWGIMPVVGLNKTKDLAIPALRKVSVFARQAGSYVADKVDGFTGRSSQGSNQSAAGLRESLKKAGSQEIELGSRRSQQDSKEGKPGDFP